MAMTIDQIAGMLEELDLTYQHQDGYLFFTMETEVYVDPEKSGKRALTLMIELMEDGEFFTLLAPRAYFVRGSHQDAFLRACARVQWRTKLVQFEWDVRDGEVRPIIELPLEDASLTRRQLQRCIYALCSIVDRYHEALHRAATEGVVVLPGDEPGDEPGDGPGHGAAAGASASSRAGDPAPASDGAPDAPDPAFLARVEAVLAARRDGADATADAGRSGTGDGAAGTGHRPDDGDQDTGPPTML
jgi:hypothetical protein